MSNLNSCILFFDFYEVTFRNKLLQIKSNKSLIGSIFGIFYCFVVITFTFFYTNSFFTRKDNINVVQHQDSISMPINNLSFTPIMLMMMDQRALPISSDSLYSFTALYRYYYYLDMPDGTRILNLTVQELKLEDCNILLQHPKYSSYQTYVKFSNFSKCIIPNNSTDITLQGRFPDPVQNFSSVQIIINKCSGNKCINDSLASKLINGAYLNLLYNSSYLDVYNSKPYENKIQSILIPISFSVKKKFYHYISQIKFFSDEGWLFENMKLYNFFKSQNLFLDLDDSLVHPYTGSPYYATISIRNSDGISFYYRSYQKFPQLLAGIASMSQVFFIFTKYSVLFFSYDNIVLNLTNKLFRFDEEEKLIISKKYSLSRDLSASNNLASYSKTKINKKEEEEKLEIKFKELILFKICCKYTKNINILKKSENFIKENLGYENLLKNYIQFYKLIEHFDIDLLCYSKLEYSKIDIYKRPNNIILEPKIELARNRKHIFPIESILKSLDPTILRENNIK